MKVKGGLYIFRDKNKNEHSNNNGRIYTTRKQSPQIKCTKSRWSLEKDKGKTKTQRPYNDTSQNDTDFM